MTGTEYADLPAECAGALGIVVGTTLPVPATALFLKPGRRGGVDRLALYRVFTVKADLQPHQHSAYHPDPRDRPYAGLLLGNLSLLSDTDRSRSVLMPHVEPARDLGEAQAVLPSSPMDALLFHIRGANAQFQGQHGGLHQFGSVALSVKF